MPPSALVALTDAELRARTSIKWSRARPGVIAADIAELDFRVANPIMATARKAVRLSDYGYPDYSAGTPVRLAEAFAARAARRFGWVPAVDRVQLCAQVIQALCGVILTCTSPGDCVLTHAPTYLPIVEAITRLGRVCRTLPVKDLCDVAELDALAEAATSDGPVRLLVLCQPHNPTGHIFDRRTLEVLGEFAERNDAVVFSDEIYQDLAYDPARFCSAAAVGELSGRSVVFTSAAKSFNIAGLRCAVGHFGSQELHEAFCELPWHLRSGASLLGINATIAAWTECDDWLDDLRLRLAKNRAIVATRLATARNVRWTVPQATYFSWLDVSDSAAGPEPRSYFLRSCQVALAPGASFGADFTGFARLNFGTSQPRLRELLDRVTSALASS